MAPRRQTSVSELIDLDCPFTMRTYLTNAPTTADNIPVISFSSSSSTNRTPVLRPGMRSAKKSGTAIPFPKGSREESLFLDALVYCRPFTGIDADSPGNWARVVEYLQDQDRTDRPSAPLFANISFTICRLAWERLYEENGRLSSRVFLSNDATISAKERYKRIRWLVQLRQDDARVKAVLLQQQHRQEQQRQQLLRQEQSPLMVVIDNPDLPKSWTRRTRSGNSVEVMELRPATASQSQTSTAASALNGSSKFVETNPKEPLRPQENITSPATADKPSSSPSTTNVPPMRSAKTTRSTSIFYPVDPSDARLLMDALASCRPFHDLEAGWVRLVEYIQEQEKTAGSTTLPHGSVTLAECRLAWEQLYQAQVKLGPRGFAIAETAASIRERSGLMHWLVQLKQDRRAACAQQQQQQQQHQQLGHENNKLLVEEDDPVSSTNLDKISSSLGNGALPSNCFSLESLDATMKAYMDPKGSKLEEVTKERDERAEVATFLRKQLQQMATQQQAFAAERRSWEVKLAEERNSWEEILVAERRKSAEQKKLADKQQQAFDAERKIRDEKLAAERSNWVQVTEGAEVAKQMWVEYKDKADMANRKHSQDLETEKRKRMAEKELMRATIRNLQLELNKAKRAAAAPPPPPPERTTAAQQCDHVQQLKDSQALVDQYQRQTHTLKQDNEDLSQKVKELEQLSKEYLGIIKMQASTMNATVHTRANKRRRTDSMSPQL
ncbi:hypothetical protein BGX33_011719 [Mortierella sp. NVP41]|nr:hypothetical protein BGX33_011719 [Mortierella sp. NVP41]